jgi:tripartite-type tricarboxylate transporter receptor subunit TctC
MGVKKVLANVVAVIGLIALSAAVRAEPWPQRSVRLIVPFGSGSAPDVAARLYAERLNARWKRPVIVENRPGAEGLIGVSNFAAQRDDHALLFSPAAPISVFPFTHDKLTYDPARDFVAISSGMDTFGSVSISASLKAGSLAEFVRLVQAQPGKFNWSAGGGAFPTLLAGFAKTADLDMVHVSYRDQSLAIQDLSEARIHVFATTLTALLPFAKAGKIRILSVTNKRRAPIAPEVPTAVESGYPELEFEGLVGFFGWRDMPAMLRDRISADVRAIAADPVVGERFAAAGQIVRGSTPAGFAEAIEEQRAKIGAIVRLVGRSKP